MTMMRKPLMIIIYGLATFIPLCGQTLISDFEKIEDTLKKALEYEQIQPILI